MRRTWRLLALVWISSIALDATPALAAIPPGRLAIGDSVMLGARDELTARGIRVNAVVSRQFRDAVPLVEQLKAAGRLRRKVVIHLGNNGILIDAADCDRISEVAGPNRTVYLVNLKIPRSYRRIQNERLAACAQRRANTAAGQLVPLQPGPRVVVRGRRVSPDADRSDEVRGLHRFGDRLIRDRLVASVDSSRWSARAAEGTRLESV